jgi:hypothetical protein
MKLRTLALGTLFLSVLATSCKKDDDNTEEAALSISETYDAAGFDEASTTNAMSQLGELSSYMKTADPTKESAAITESELSTKYKAGDLSLKDISSAKYVEAAEAAFAGLETASASGTGDTDFDLANPNNSTNGGKAGDHLFNGEPLELEQIVEKAAYIGASFNYAKNTLFASPSAVSVDELNAALALYGSEPTFSTEKGICKWSANYAKGLYPEEGGEESYHDLINYQFRKAQSAAKQGFAAEKAAAVEEILVLWEKAIAAKAVSYLTGVVNVLAAGNLDYDAIGGAGYIKVADAIHSYSEGVAFLTGFNGVEGVSISSTELSKIMEQINAPIGGESDVLILIGDEDELADVNTAIASIESIFEL